MSSESIDPLNDPRRAYVITVAVYEGDHEAIMDAVSAVVPEDGSCLLSGRYEDDA
jgi:hypothetical protein